MNRGITGTMGLALPAMLMISLLSVLSFSYAPLSVAVSPNTSITLDYNQSAFNFSATASGGVPFGPNNSSYVYFWTIQKNTTCPGFSTLYPHQRSSLLYIPNGTTTRCVFKIQVADNTGNTTYTTTGNIVVNKLLSSLSVLSKSNYTIYQGQNVTVFMGTPTGGTPPYHYQWLASTGLASPLTSGNGDSLCSLSNDGLICMFNTNYSTKPGLYEFQLSYSDSASAPASLLSNPVLIRVAQSQFPAIPSNSQTTSSSSSTTSLATTSTPTTVTTTIVQTTPTTPLAQAGVIVSDSGKLIESWLKAIIGYII